jgi:hypothetical protein
MGFLQICAGVVLLQLSKSAKDVPDTAVLKGDLDQMRTVAEQEEPEYEPRADTIRGGAAIIRSLSRARTEKQMMEIRRLQDEQMAPIGENEQFEFDGLRRRRTVMDLNHAYPERTGTVIRHKTIHPPLGMSQFPTDDSDNESDLHPGFFQRLRSRGKSSASDRSARSRTAPVGLSNLNPIQSDGPSDAESDKKSYMQADTSYKPHDTTIQFAPIPSPPEHERQTSQSSSLAAPKPPLHTAKRQFSFQNVFGRNRAQSTGEGSGSMRPTSRNSRKSSKDHAPGQSTEEERLGLVKGDSTTLLPIQSRGSMEVSAAPPGYFIDDAWRRSDSPGVSPSRPTDIHGAGMRRVETDESEFNTGKDVEKGAFL